jgi:hypothetical protein
MTISELQNETDGHLQSLNLEVIRNQVRTEEESDLVPFGIAHPSRHTTPDGSNSSERIGSPPFMLPVSVHFHRFIVMSSLRK